MSSGQFRSMWSHVDSGLGPLKWAKATRVATAPLEKAMEMNGTDHELPD